MPHEAVIGEDAPKVGMALEQDAEEIKGLTLVPAHPGPDLTERADRWVLIVATESPHTQPLVQVRREQMQHNSKPRPFVTMTAPGFVVDPAQIDGRIKAQTNRIATNPGGGLPLRRRHFERHFPEGLAKRDDLVRQGLLERRFEGFVRGGHGVSGQSYWFGGFCSAAAKCRKSGLPQSADSLAHRCRPARSGHNPGRLNRSNGNNRHHWRRSPC